MEDFQPGVNDENEHSFIDSETEVKPPSVDYYAVLAVGTNVGDSCFSVVCCYLVTIVLLSNFIRGIYTITVAIINIIKHIY